MDECNEWSNVFYLVLLKMSDEVPLNVLWHNLLFLREFLYPALSKYALSCIIGFEQRFDGMKLRNGDELRICRECFM